MIARPAEAAARWTFVTVLSGRYVEMQSRFERVGASNEVNVLVLHANDTGMFAYRSLRDPDSGHPPGECCADSGPGCCETETIELGSLGIEGAAIDHEVVDKFLKYAQEQYPADHYLVSFRGHWAGTRILPSVGAESSPGIAILELATLLRDFAARRGGQHLEVLNLGLCMGANTEWLYPLSPWVDYVVGAANWTNSPVSVRWRNYRWARELIKDPSLGSRELALRMMDIFAEPADGCGESATGCSNAASGQPWTASALDMSRYDDLSAAMRDMVCALLADFPEEAITNARDEAICYGSSSPHCEGPSGLRDLEHFVRNLRARVQNPALIAAIDKLSAAHAAVVMQRVWEPGYYAGQAYGLGTLFETESATPGLIGNFQLDTRWRLVLDRLSHADEPASDVDQVTPEPSSSQADEDAGLETRVSGCSRGPSGSIPPWGSVEGESLTALPVEDSGRSAVSAGHPGADSDASSGIEGASEVAELSQPDSGHNPDHETPPDSIAETVASCAKLNGGQSGAAQEGCACQVPVGKTYPPPAKVGWCAAPGVLATAALRRRTRRRRGTPRKPRRFAGG